MSAQPAEASQIRPMRQADIDAVMDIEQRAYEFPWTPGIFRDCLRVGHQCWVLRGAPGIIGYGVLSGAAGEAHVLNLCIAPEHQGHGHGRRMLRRLVDLARWHQAERVFLEVRPSNPARSRCTTTRASTRSAAGRTTTRRRRAARTRS